MLLDAQDFPRATGAGPAQDERGGGHVLDADPGEIADGDVGGAHASGLQAGRDLAQLGGDPALRHRSRSDGVMDLSEPEALRAAVGDDQIGPRQNADFELLLVGAVGADGGHVDAVIEPRGATYRFAAACHGEYY